jgi:hypothetical protein
MAHDNQHRYAKGLFGLLLIAAGLHLPLTHAADQEDDEVNTGWQESALQLPAAPKSENLLPFYNSGTQTFSIDKPSVSVEKDGSVRYTLVSTSSNGAKTSVMKRYVAKAMKKAVRIWSQRRHLVSIST